MYSSDDGEKNQSVSVILFIIALGILVVLIINKLLDKLEIFNKLF